jgi:hypothetical protein
MLASVRAMLAGVIDYAGLFPPARLPLEEAVRNFARYRQEPENWMLGRFVCPAARLAELAPLVGQLFPTGSPVVISALGRGGKNGPEFEANLRADLQVIVEFNGRHGKVAAVDMLEVRFLAADVGHLRFQLSCQLLDQVADLPKILGCNRLTPFFEASLEGDWRDSILCAIRALEATNHWIASETFLFSPGGFKLRCGQSESSVVPTSEQVAFIIATCRKEGVAVKFTAGLHHPVRHFDQTGQAPVHGFLNLFAAGVLSHAGRTTQSGLQKIIEEEKPGAFQFLEDGFRWQGLCASTEEIATARRKLVTSFGSCSFDEPRDDLRAMGLLD